MRSPTSASRSSRVGDGRAHRAATRLRWVRRLRRLRRVRRLVGTLTLLGGVLLGGVLLGGVFWVPSAARATIPPEQPPDTAVPATTVPGAPIDPNATSTTVDPASTTTLPIIIEPESGAPVPAPSAQPSEPLVQTPNGCLGPPIASAVFVGRVVAKDTRVARYQIEAVRAGTVDGYALGDLIDVRYGNEVQYLRVGDQYLVGAAPQGPDRVLTSKVRPAEPLFGGNAVIGLTEKASDCPIIEDPVRTLQTDGTEIDAGMFQALSADKQGIVLSFVKPVIAVFAIVLGLVLIRWLFTAIFAAVRHAADGEPVHRSNRPI